MPELTSLAVDVTSAIYQSGGIGRYTRCLVTALAAMGAVPSLTAFWCGRPRDPIPTWLITLRGVRLRRIPIPERLTTIVWQRARLPFPIDAILGHHDVLHFPDFVHAPVRSGATVVTIHDLSFRRIPEAADPGLRRYLNAAVPRSLATSQLVFADSAATRDDLVALLNIRSSDVRVVYSGVGAEFQPIHLHEELAAVRARYALPDSFVLSVGTLQPRKNYGRLIEAMPQILQQVPDTHLVIAGRPGWLYDDLAALTRSHHLEQRVHFVTDVQDSDLPALYSLARVFAFVSLYEGFGLPILEAMACGVPVVASNASCLPEVTGDAGLQVDPTDIDSIARAVATLLLDDALRTQMVVRGRKRAARFTWRQTAEQALAGYAEAWARQRALKPSHLS